MKERGIALPGKPKTQQMIMRADLVVTADCSGQDVCPVPLVQQMRMKTVDSQIEDPKGKQITEIRQTAAKIESRVMELLKR
jgi:protein-tyrosine-phosphatase